MIKGNFSSISPSDECWGIKTIILNYPVIKNESLFSNDEHAIQDG